MSLKSAVSEDRGRAFQSLAFFSCFLAAGMSTAIVGPCLLDLSQQVSESVDRTSLLLTGRSVGLAIGALVSGVVHPRLNFLMTTAVASLCASICCAVAAHVVTLDLLIAVFGLNGLFMGLIEGGSTVFLLNLWRGSPHTLTSIQSAYFMYGIGGLLTPLLVQPFLKTRAEDQQEDELMDDYGLKEEDGLRAVSGSGLRLVVPFSVLSFILLMNSVLAATALLRFPRNLEQEDKQMHVVDGEVVLETDTESGAPAPNTASQTETGSESTVWKLVVVLMHLFFIHAFYGMMIMMESFLMTYVHESADLMLTKTVGSQMTSLYWTTMTFGKVLSLAIVPNMGTRNTIAASLLVQMIGALLICPAFGESETRLWLAVGLIGLGNSSLFALILSFLAQYFVVSNVIGSLTSVAGVMGEFSFPIIISFLIRDDIDIIPWIACTNSAIMISVFALIVITAHVKFGKKL